MTILYRGNESGEILDADGKVIGRVVPPTPTVESCDAMLMAIGRGFDHASPTARGNAVYAAYIRAVAAATLDLSAAAVRVPEQIDPNKWAFDQGLEST